MPQQNQTPAPGNTKRTKKQNIPKHRAMQAVDVIMGEIIHLIVEQVVFARGLIE